jgi:hypothetical protein
VTDELAVFQPSEVGADRFRVRVDGLGDLPTSICAIVVVDEKSDNALARRWSFEIRRNLEALIADRQVL